MYIHCIKNWVKLIILFEIIYVYHIFENSTTNYKGFDYLTRKSDKLKLRFEIQKGLGMLQVNFKLYECQ